MSKIDYIDGQIPEELLPYVNKIMDAMDHVSSAWVSSQSCISDFCPHQESTVAFLGRFSDKIGVEIERADNNILTVARALREKDERQ